MLQFDARSPAQSFCIKQDLTVLGIALDSVGSLHATVAFALGQAHRHWMPRRSQLCRRRSSAASRVL
eukprot:4505510-Lingulodinium_polyedra.AAC.1